MVLGGIGVKDEWLIRVWKPQDRVPKKRFLQRVEGLLTQWCPELQDTCFLLPLHLWDEVLDGLCNRSVVGYMVSQEIGEPEKTAYFSDGGWWCQLHDILDLGWSH